MKKRFMILLLLVLFGGIVSAETIFVTDSHLKFFAKINGNHIEDERSNTILRLDNNVLWDSRLKFVAKIEGNFIKDERSNTIVRMSGTPSKTQLLALLFFLFFM
ncbi:hypothetical protein FACS189444_2640 [Spirochaetia bacterium]|nr:hypothetical protein FACS189444_2640 [Spirochaetia bacterium]